MRTKIIFHTILSLIILLMACILGIQAAEPQQPPIAKVKSDTAKVDSLTWYAGPLPVFESQAEFDKFITRQSNVIRDRSILPFGQSDKAYIKNRDGSITSCIIESRTEYHQKVSIDSVPVILKEKFKDVEYYNLRQNISDNYDNISSSIIGKICRVNHINYRLPYDLNLLCGVNINSNLTLNEKIEIVISTFNGFNTHYTIQHILAKAKEITNIKTDYEVAFIANNVKYVGYLVIEKTNLDILFIQKENDNKFMTIGFNK